MIWKHWVTCSCTSSEVASPGRAWRYFHILLRITHVLPLYGRHLSFCLIFKWTDPLPLLSAFSERFTCSALSPSRWKVPRYLAVLVSWSPVFVNAARGVGALEYWHWHNILCSPSLKQALATWPEVTRPWHRWHLRVSSAAVHRLKRGSSTAWLKPHWLLLRFAFD